MKKLIMGLVLTVLLSLPFTAYAGTHSPGTNSYAPAKPVENVQP